MNDPAMNRWTHHAPASPGAVVQPASLRVFPTGMCFRRTLLRESLAEATIIARERLPNLRHAPAVWQR